jgi:hypothetical protein
VQQLRQALVRVRLDGQRLGHRQHLQQGHGVLITAFSAGGNEQEREQS